MFELLDMFELLNMFELHDMFELPDMLDILKFSVFIELFKFKSCIFFEIKKTFFKLFLSLDVFWSKKEIILLFTKGKILINILINVAYL